MSSRPFACRGSYPAGHRYTLVLAQLGRAAPLHLGMFPVSRDGAFTAVVHIPQRASPGQSYIDVTGSLFDHCEDTKGVAASCAGYDAPFRVLPRIDKLTRARLRTPNPSAPRALWAAQCRSKR